jgi:hypothetical protein
MECRLQNTVGPWKCQVLLRFEKDQTGRRISAVHEVKFGPLLTETSELEEMLRRAQLAILNPDVPYASFVDFDTSTVVPGQPLFGDKVSLQFSSNVVALDLYVLQNFLFLATELDHLTVTGIARVRIQRIFPLLICLGSAQNDYVSYSLDANSFHAQIISNVADGEDRNNITLVQDLVKDHIKGNSIILLTLTMRGEPFCA